MHEKFSNAQSREEKGVSERSSEMRDMRKCLEDARAIRRLLGLLLKYPGHSAEEFSQLARTKMKISGELLETFLNTLLDIKSSVRRVLGEAYEQAHERNITTGERLYRMATLNTKYSAAGYTPYGRIDYDDSFPLAPVLYMEDPRDYDFLHKSGTAGFFHPSFDYMRKNRSSNRHFQLDSFPIIAVKGLIYRSDRLLSFKNEMAYRQLQGTREHEQRHAEIESVETAIRKAKHDLVWAGNMTGTEILKKVQLLQEVSERGIGAAMSSQEAEELQQFALYAARHELLSDTGRISGFLLLGTSGGIVDRLVAIKEKGGVYDVFSQFGISVGSKLHEALWLKYLSRLSPASRIAGLVGNYLHFDLVKRAGLFKWVLAQYDITDWGAEGPLKLFYKEMEEWASLRELLIQKHDAGKKEALEYLKQMIRLAEKNPERPLFRIMKQIRSKIDQQELL